MSRELDFFRTQSPISDPGANDKHPHHHQAEISILTGNGPVGPKPIQGGALST